MFVPLLSSVSLVAYLGPGGVLSTIGSVIALVGAVALAVLGFVWYPMKRMLRARGNKAAATLSQDGAVDSSEDAQA